MAAGDTQVRVEGKSRRPREEKAESVSREENSTRGHVFRELQVRESR